MGIIMLKKRKNKSKFLCMTFLGSGVWDWKTDFRFVVYMMKPTCVGRPRHISKPKQKLGLYTGRCCGSLVLAGERAMA